MWNKVEIRTFLIVIPTLWKVSIICKIHKMFFCLLKWNFNILYFYIFLYISNYIFLYIYNFCVSIFHITSLCLCCWPNVRLTPRLLLSQVWTHWLHDCLLSCQLSILLFSFPYLLFPFISENLFFATFCAEYSPPKKPKQEKYRIQWIRPANVRILGSRIPFFYCPPPPSPPPPTHPLPPLPLPPKNFFFLGGGGKRGGWGGTTS